MGDLEERVRRDRAQPDVRCCGARCGCAIDGAKIADRVRELAAGGVAASGQGGTHSDRHRFWSRLFRLSDRGTPAAVKRVSGKGASVSCIHS